MSILQSTAGMKFLDIITYPEISITKDAFTCITGESGCGKSTYLRLLNRTALPKCGDIFYQGENIEMLDKIAYRRKVLLVPQELFLLDDTIRENFQFYYESREEKAPSEERMQEMLRICLADFSLDTKCSQLSGGEKQRVFLAIFLSFQPKVLLLDEPTSALDAKTATQLLTNIKEYCQKNGTTAVCICHSRELVDTFADEVIEMGGVKA